ncbi:MAG: hypothetical protein WCT44_01580 [Candidatus Paceibacterota bacterium]
MVPRILFSILLFISVIFWPFWLSVLLAIVGMVYFSHYWEAVTLLLLSDVLYGVKEAKFSGMIFVSFFISIIVILLVEAFKRSSNLEFLRK